MNPRPKMSVQTEQLYEKVAQLVGEAILSGTYPPGCRLPSEQELGQHMGVGRSTIREALASLAALGALSIHQGKGIFVKDLPVALLRVRLNRFKEPYSTAHAWETRMIIEKAAAGLAALRRTKSDLQAMEEAITNMDLEIAQGKLGGEEGTLFHLHLLEAAHNPVLLQLGEDLGALSTRVRRWTLGHPGRPQSSNEEHWKIFEAIRNQDSEAAVECTRLHLEWGLYLTQTEESSSLSTLF